MKIGFVVDPLPTFNIKKDSTYAMMAEASQRGHELYTMQQEELVWKRGSVFGMMSQITLRKDAEHWYALDPTVEIRLKDLDCVLMRKDPPFDVEYVTSTWLLEQAQREGAKVFNDPRALRDHSEKMSLSQFPQFIPRRWYRARPTSCTASSTSTPTWS
jgi:glutathione synthase